MWAPGKDIRMAGKPPNGYKLDGGTSFAAPYVSGYACALLDPAEDYEALRTAAVRPGELKSLLYSRFRISQEWRWPEDDEVFREVGNEPHDGEDHADYGDDGDTEDNMALDKVDKSDEKLRDDQLRHPQENSKDDPNMISEDDAPDKCEYVTAENDDQAATQVCEGDNETDQDERSNDSDN